MTTAKCYLLQPPNIKHDLSDLTAFGVPTVLFSRGFYPDDVAQYRESILGTLDDKLQDFAPHIDHIVPMGDSCVVAVVAAYLSTEGLLPASFLKYDKKLQGFYSIKIG